MYEQIAIDIKENGRFCLWRYEKQQGRQTKVPYQISDQRASSRNIQHFTSFEEVIKAVPRYDGIGMGVFSPFAAVDIDDCVKDGKLSLWVFQLYCTSSFLRHTHSHLSNTIMGNASANFKQISLTFAPFMPIFLTFEYKLDYLRRLDFSGVHYSVHSQKRIVYQN